MNWSSIKATIYTKPLCKITWALICCSLLSLSEVSENMGNTRRLFSVASTNIKQMLGVFCANTDDS